MRIAKRYVEAFKENYNVVGLTTAMALSAATLNPLPLLAGVVAEAAYLLFVPDSKWYDARLSKRYDAEVEQRREKLKKQVWPRLSWEIQTAYQRLEDIRGQISASPAEGASWLPEVLRKLDYLLEKFLMFASKDVQFRAYLGEILTEVCGDPHRAGNRGEADFNMEGIDSRRLPYPPIPQPPEGRPRGPRRPQSQDAPTVLGQDWVNQTVAEIHKDYDREIAGVQEAREEEQDIQTQAVLEKRLEVLQRRKEYVGKIAKILINLNHQLQLVEDTFGLINDEICVRSPEQVLADIEDVVSQTNSMTKVLEEVAPYEQMLARMQQAP